MTIKHCPIHEIDVNGWTHKDCFDFLHKLKIEMLKRKGVEQSANDGDDRDSFDSAKSNGYDLGLDEAIKVIEEFVRS